MKVAPAKASSETAKTTAERASANVVVLADVVRMLEMRMDTNTQALEPSSLTWATLYGTARSRSSSPAISCSSSSDDDSEVGGRLKELEVEARAAVKEPGSAITDYVNLPASPLGRSSSIARTSMSSSATELPWYRTPNAPLARSSSILSLSPSAPRSWNAREDDYPSPVISPPLSSCVCGVQRIRSNSSLQRDPHNIRERLGQQYTPRIVADLLGTGIYLYLAATFNVSTLFISAGCDFYLDGEHVGSFVHEAGQMNEYFLLAYANSSLLDGPHTFVCDATIFRTNFDFLRYTSDDPDPTTSSSTSSTASTVPSSTTAMISNAAATSTSNFPLSDRYTISIAAIAGGFNSNSI
ncbi:hypothetical protein C8R44DRAFT_973909 [Mycena epipterygia]|nr:hypothetical protein C8R44DRAFT_973909 [Mycena epipterygia]